MHVDLVLLHEERNAVYVRFYDACFARDHLRKVGFGLVYFDAVFPEVMLCVVEMLCRIEQRLRRYTSNVETRASKGVVLFDNGCFEAKLRTTNGSNITAWAGTDHYYV